LFVSLDADIKKMDANQEAFDEAARNGHLDVLKFLLSLPGVNPTADDNNNVFRWAASAGHLDVLKFLQEEERIKAGNANSSLIDVLNEYLCHVPTGPLQLIYHFCHASCVPSTQQAYTKLITKKFIKSQQNIYC
jgi:ankyrin repeat protein